MSSKTTDWRPGPSVCRCCLSEGCYKDISTEYFWMGKREVYAEMLLETLSLSISYSQSGGPNSNSRLICEACISRLRDASEFRRQVQECERTFMQYLDPGTSAAELEVEALPVESIDTQVKVERVKLEKEPSEGDFDDRGDLPDLDDDDDDDLDDQPLTRLASKIPKKESVDLLDLLDNSNAKVGEKRKSSSKAKTPAAKKSKSKKEAKATSSKPKPEKKKKGPEDVPRNVKSEFSVQVKWKRKRRVEEDKANAALILQYSNAFAFRCQRGKFMCAYCQTICPSITELRTHTLSHDKLQIFENPDIRLTYPLRIEITDLACTLCNESVPTVKDLKSHLSKAHEKETDSDYSDGVIPFILTDKEFRCVVCGSMFERFLSLFVHMNKHYQTHVCPTCGKGFSARHKLRAHLTCHESGQFACSKCDLVFMNRASKNRHMSVGHGRKERYRCPVCDIHLDSYHSRLKHMDVVHGQKVEYRCSLCPAVFGSNTARHSHNNVVHLKKRKRIKK